MADPPVTLKDVAARARVHPATASRALNPETRLLVREDTAQRVLEAAAELGYRPNTGGPQPAHPALAQRRGADPGPEQPAVPAHRAGHRGPAGRGRLRGADRQHRRGRGARARCCSSRCGPGTWTGWCWPPCTWVIRCWPSRPAADLPVVLMNRLAQDYSLPSVSVDNERGIRMAVAHLAAAGAHPDRATSPGPQEVSTGLARYRGFMAAMEAHGLRAGPGPDRRRPRRSRSRRGCAARRRC